MLKASSHRFGGDKIQHPEGRRQLRLADVGYGADNDGSR